MTNEYACRVNKHPYILFATQGLRAFVDFEQMTIETANIKSGISHVNPLQVFILKIFPILLLLLIGGVAPDSMKESLLFACGAGVAFTVLFVFLNYIQWFKLFILASSAGVWFFMLNGADSYTFERVFLYSTECVMLGYIAYEIATGRLEKWYFLEDVQSEVTVKNPKGKTPLFRIGKKEFLQVSNFQYLQSYRLSGFFLFINDVIVEEAKNENDS